MRNRTRILLLAGATLLLTAAVVAGANEWVRQSGAITMMVGPEGSPEARFAHRLSETLRQSHASVRLKVVTSETRAQALQSFSHRETDLAILRTDERKIPPAARALAILEREALLLIGPKKAKLSTLADLKGKRVVVVGRDGRNEAFLRRLLEQYKADFSKTPIRTVTPGTPLETLLPAEADWLVLVYPLSRLTGTGDFDALAQAVKSFTVHGLGDAKALERKVPGVTVETVEAGLLSGAPRIPEEDLETVSLQKILVVRRGLPEPHVVEVMRALFENGRQLAVENSFATRIEPPDTEKGALIAAHEGANQYVDSDVKTFFDRYSDLIYLGMSVASILGSVAAALYGTLFRHKPKAAGDRVAETLALCERIREAEPDQLEALTEELETLFAQTLRGLADGSASEHGLEAFRLSYDHARELLEARRTAA